jgi:CRP/FNR family transcriptional regulator, cyclic AMP receptor protein
MQTIDQYLPAHPFFAGLDSETTDLLAGCAVNVHVRAGEFLFRANDPADHFYVLRRGRVAIEVHTPARGVVLDTVDEGEVVGWSWMVPPYRWAFDARATLDSSAVAFDATCLRAKCDADPVIGYELMKRFILVMDHRLQSARIRLLDLYGEFVD